VCVCVCVRERERESRENFVCIFTYISRRTETERNITKASVEKSNPLARNYAFHFWQNPHSEKVKQDNKEEGPGSTVCFLLPRRGLIIPSTFDIFPFLIWTLHSFFTEDSM